MDAGRCASGRLRGQRGGEALGRNLAGGKLSAFRAAWGELGGMRLEPADFGRAVADIDGDQRRGSHATCLPLRGEQRVGLSHELVEPLAGDGGDEQDFAAAGGGELVAEFAPRRAARLWRRRESRGARPSCASYCASSSRITR